MQHPGVNLRCCFSLKDDELAGRMGLQPKELNKVIAVLSNDSLVKVCATRLNLPILRFTNLIVATAKTS